MAARVLCWCLALHKTVTGAIPSEKILFHTLISAFQTRSLFNRLGHFLAQVHLLGQSINFLFKAHLGNIFDDLHGQR